MTDQNILDAINQALDKDPRNGPLWLHYSQLLTDGGKYGEALEALRSALAAGQEPKDLGARWVMLLRRNGLLAEALIRAEELLKAHEDHHLRLELAHIHAERDQRDEALDCYRRAIAGDEGLRDRELEKRLGIGGADDEMAPTPGKGAAPTAGPEKGSQGETASMDKRPLTTGNEPSMAKVSPEPMDDDEWANQFDWGGLRVTFDDVAGLQDVKRQIELRIIAPYKNPEIYRAFRRQSGGGILLYGPPGCGKTFMARATAGELEARFISVSLHEVIDRYWGESEKMVHALFTEARDNAPAVVFFDEFDALGASRGKIESQFFRTLVNQLLQEMDGLSGRNEDVLLFAATNMPWTVDPAFRRPGRFDRVLFVPPPDQEARIQIMQTHLEKAPGGSSIDVSRLARETNLMTGADLKALCDQALEYPLERSLDSGKVNKVTNADFRRALKEVKSSAIEWLSTARNYAKYSNEGGHYDDLAEFLRKVKRW